MPSAYYNRVTARIPATQAAHPDWSLTQVRQFLRGHSTTAEHGITARFGDTYEVYRTGDVEQALNKAIKDHGPRARVEITTYQANGDSRQVLKETRPNRPQRGVTASAIRDRMAQGESFRDAVTNVMHGRRYKGDRRWRNVTRVHISVIEEN